MARRGTARRIRRTKRIPAEPSGDIEEMKAIGEAISGTQPEIGHKDTGIGRRRKEGLRRPGPRGR